MDAQLLLQLDQEVEEDVVAARGVGDEAGELPEMGLLLARRGPERDRVDGAEALGEDAEATLAE